MTDASEKLASQQVAPEVEGKSCYEYIKTPKYKDFRSEQSRVHAYEEYRKKWGQYPTSPDDFPRVSYQVDIDVVDACNLKCTYCFDRTRKRTGVAMSQETLQALIEQLRIHPIFCINLGFCSEPFIRFDLVKQLFDVARPICGIPDLIIHTNGLLLTEEVAAYLVDREVSLICISVSAADNETYKKLCHGDQYDRIVENVARLKKYRDQAGKKLPLIRTSMVLVPENLGKEQAFIDRWSPIADKIEFQRYRNVCKTQSSGAAKTPEHVICPWPFMRMSVWPDGTLGVCPFTGSLNPDIALPFNIRTSDIKEVWNSSRVNSIRKRLFKNLNGTCVSCIADFEA